MGAEDSESLLCEALVAHSAQYPPISNRAVWIVNPFSLPTSCFSCSKSGVAISSTRPQPKQAK